LRKKYIKITMEIMRNKKDIQKQRIKLYNMILLIPAIEKTTTPHTIRRIYDPMDG